MDIWNRLLFFPKFKICRKIYILWLRKRPWNHLSILFFSPLHNFSRNTKFPPRKSSNPFLKSSWLFLVLPTNPAARPFSGTIRSIPTSTAWSSMPMLFGGGMGSEWRMVKLRNPGGIGRWWSQHRRNEWVWDHRIPLPNSRKRAMRHTNGLTLHSDGHAVYVLLNSYQLSWCYLQHRRNLWPRPDVRSLS